MTTQNHSEPTIRIDNASIIFGNKTNQALALADQGKDRRDIQLETDAVLGVHDCTLDIYPGEIVVLMGLSGSGKSTLLRAINKLNPISRGTVTVTTHRATTEVGTCSASALRKMRGQDVAMVFQQFGLLPWRSVLDNVGLGLELSGMAKKDREAAVREQLAIVGLEDWADSPVSALSGGMQQRVGLARAFATGAPILLMDEPFSALDPLIRTHLQDELLDLQKRLQKTIVFVSHDLDEAIKLGNRIAIMEGGRIVQMGTPTDIVTNPTNQYVADFVRHINPLSVLTAGDIARPAEDMPTGTKIVGTAKPSTPLTDIVHALAKREGAVGVVDNGHIIGAIANVDIVALIAKFGQDRTINHDQAHTAPQPRG